MATLDQKDISNVEIIIANLASQVKIIKNLWDQKDDSDFTNVVDYDGDNVTNDHSNNFFEVLQNLITKDASDNPANFIFGDFTEVNTDFGESTFNGHTSAIDVSNGGPDKYITNTNIPINRKNHFGLMKETNTLYTGTGTNPDLRLVRNLLIVVSDLIFNNLIYTITALDGSDGKGSIIGTGTWSTDLTNIVNYVSRDQDINPFDPSGGIYDNATNIEYHLFRVIKALVQLRGKVDVTNQTQYDNNIKELKQINATVGTTITPLTDGSGYGTNKTDGVSLFDTDIDEIIKHFFKKVKDLTNELKAYATNNINSTNNTIDYDSDGGTTYTYTIPRGKYDAEYLADYLNSRKHTNSTSDPWDFRFAYNEVKNNFAVKNLRSADVSLNVTSDASGVLGFKNGSDLLFTPREVKTDLGEKANFTIKTLGEDPNTPGVAYKGRSSDMVISTTKIAKNSAFITMVHAYQTIGEPLF
jgi:hypothetical protein